VSDLRHRRLRDELSALAFASTVIVNAPDEVLISGELFRLQRSQELLHVRSGQCFRTRELPDLSHRICEALIETYQPAVAEPVLSEVTA
jgi:hypothetical protein